LAPVTRPVSAGFPALGGDQWRRRNAVAPETARHLLAMSASYGRYSEAMTATGFFEVSRAHLSLILDLHPGWQLPAVRPELLRAVGISATWTASVLYNDLERYAEALPYLDLAQDAARENDDPDLAVLVLVCRAFLTNLSGAVRHWRRSSPTPRSPRRTTVR
jgi:hypothetical protein